MGRVAEDTVVTGEKSADRGLESQAHHRLGFDG